MVRPSRNSPNDGTHTSVGGAWTLLVHVLMFAGAFLTGRMWRLISAWRRQHHQTPLVVTDEERIGGRA